MLAENSAAELFFVCDIGFGGRKKEKKREKMRVARDLAFRQYDHKTKRQVKLNLSGNPESVLKFPMF